MDAGQIVEIGEPNVLKRDKNGYFHALLKQHIQQQQEQGQQQQQYGTTNNNNPYDSITGSTLGMRSEDENRLGKEAEGLSKERSSEEHDSYLWRYYQYWRQSHDD